VSCGRHSFVHVVYGVPVFKSVSFSVNTNSQKKHHLRGSRLAPILIYVHLPGK